jgi:hypothetical protein
MAELKQLIGLRAQFPTLPVRHPEYVNSAIVNILNDDFLIEFGFIDSYLIPQYQEALKTNEDAYIPISPVTRVALSRQVAEVLMAQLSEHLRAVQGKVAE